MGQEYNEKVFSVHNPSILRCVLVGTCSRSAIVIASVKVASQIHFHFLKTDANSSSSICDSWSNIYRHVSIRT